MALFLRCMVAAGLVAALALPGRPVQAQVDPQIVVTGGLGQSCYEMSRAISRGHPEQTIEVTGSHIRLGAIDICNAAVRDHTMSARDLAGTYNNRGVIYFTRGEFKRAADDFTQAMRRDTTLPAVYINHGGALIALKRFAEAKILLDKAIAMDGPAQANAYYNRAIVHEEEGSARGAYLDYVKASELSPEWEEPRKHLTRFQVQKKAPAAR